MDQARPELSLVIPAYNEEKYLGACLAAALEHGRGRFREIVVVDNGSTDGTAEVARKYPGVTVVREPRKGTGFARDTGWRATTAPLIAFLDADTHLRPRWVDRVHRAFHREPALACITGPYWFYDLPLANAVLIWLNWHFAYVGNLFTGTLVVGGNFVIRRDVLEKMNGFDTTITFHGDDVDIGRRAAKFGTVRLSFKIILDSSGRRYRALGTLRTLGLYIKNGFIGAFHAVPKYTSEYFEIR